MCKIKYIISRENNETYIEFKNLSITDQNLAIFLVIDNQLLFLKSQRDNNDQGPNYTKSAFYS